MIFDEFGNPVKPPYIDDRAASFALLCPGLPKEIAESIKHSQNAYRTMKGIVLYDADGSKVALESNVVSVSSKPFRVPFMGKK